MTEAALDRRDQIISKAQELLTDKPVGGGNHRFLVSANEAHTIGEAISRRDYAALNDVLGGATESMNIAYAETPISSVQATWEEALREATALPGDTLEFIKSSEHRAEVISLLERDIYGDELNAEPAIYVKLLETLAYATAPDIPDFKDRYFTAKSYRKADSQRALFSRVMRTLATLADQEPGIRGVREKLLADDATGLDEYLHRYSTMNLAREAYVSIYENFSEGRAATVRDETLAQLGELQPEEELLLTHILTWTILPPEISERRDKRAIKKAALDRAVTEHQRRRLEKDWSDERIELIFDIARLGLDTNRQPNIYISSTFDNGAGIYLAVGLTHPRDAGKQIVVADNPVNGNALYFVDELNTQIVNGEPYAWHEVLGGQKQIARDRGATRRYHTGNWVEVAHAVCEYTGERRTANVDTPASTPPASEKVERSEAMHNALERLERAMKLADDVLRKRLR